MGTESKILRPFQMLKNKRQTKKQYRPATQKVWEFYIKAGEVGRIPSNQWHQESIYHSSKCCLLEMSSHCERTITKINHSFLFGKMGASLQTLIYSFNANPQLR